LKAFSEEFDSKIHAKEAARSRATQHDEVVVPMVLCSVISHHAKGGSDRIDRTFGSRREDRVTRFRPLASMSRVVSVSHFPEHDHGRCEVRRWIAPHKGDCKASYLGRASIPLDHPE
jgi:hypothetical protein